MGKYLITGVSGTGKTTIAKEMQRLGYSAFDTDSVPKLAAWIERATGKQRPKEFNSAKDWVDRYDWLWDEKCLRELLESQNEPLFFCGSSANQENFYSLFTQVFLLEIDDLSLQHRLLQSKRDHEFGRRPGEMEVILGWYKDFQEKTKSSGAIVIDATESLKKVIHLILDQVHNEHAKI